MYLEWLKEGYNINDRNKVPEICDLKPSEHCKDEVFTNC